MLQSLDQWSIVRVFHELVRKTFDRVRECESQSRSVQGHPHRPCLVENCLDTNRIEAIQIFKRLTERAVECQFTCRLEEAWWRNPKVRHESHHRSMGFIELAINGFCFGEG